MDQDDTNPRSWARALPGLSGSGPPAPGAVADRAHPAGVLRDRVPVDGAVRRVALSADRRRAVSHAGEALVEGDADAVRRRRRDRNDPDLRVRVAVAGLRRELRQRLRPGLLARGVLVLRRGDLHRDL